MAKSNKSESSTMTPVLYSDRANIVYHIRKCESSDGWKIDQVLQNAFPNEELHMNAYSWTQELGESDPDRAQWWA